MVDIYPKNYKHFNSICKGEYGRKVIHTNRTKITRDNIVEELNKALPIHEQNAVEINYLDRYYRGDKPVHYRKRTASTRADVNNKVAINLSKMIVDIKTSELVGEPVQYVLRGTDERKSEEVAKLNAIFEGEDKIECDIEICTWKSICGTAYRFIGNDNSEGELLDESPFSLEACDPRNTFVAYYNDNKPAFGCKISLDEEEHTQYFIYTKAEWFIIKDGKIFDSGINGNGAIPIVEYPNNARRISDIELTIDIEDNINKIASDRSNDIEQFVSSWIKFLNCDIDKKQFLEMKQMGILAIKSNNGNENKADVSVLTTELNQTQTQVAVEDLYEDLLVVQGIANRQGNSSGDTGNAVSLRNGFYTQEKRSEILEPIFKKAEKQALRIILNRLRITQGCSLLPSDVEIKISRTKSDNMLTKAEVLQILLTSGINPSRAIKTAGLFSDPEQVAVESRERMNILYPTTDEKAVETSVVEE